MIDPKKRYNRQADLVKLSLLQDKLVTIIGVGAVGRQIALSLASMGIPNIQLIDFDRVEDVNLASQGYMEPDLAKFKAEATAEHMARLNSDVNITIINEGWNPDLDVGHVVFCCVDDIEVRGLIFNAVKDKIELWVDGRMAKETLRVISAWDKPSNTYYAKTLFTKAEAYQGACTARSTIYTSNVIAGMMVCQLTKKLRGTILDRDLQFNMFTSEFSAEDISK